MPTKAFDLVGSIIAFETGEASTQETLDLFSDLIKTGQAWTLQGSYGRFAHTLIEQGIIDTDGTILKSADELEAEQE